MRKRRLTVIGLAAAGLAALAATTPATAARAPNAVATASAASCQTPAIALMAPITGPAATIGKEIRNWVRFAVQTYNARKTQGSPTGNFKLKEFDTQLDAAQASTRAQQIVSDSSILFVDGPAGSQEVLAVKQSFTRARLAHVSGSATATNLTKPGTKEKSVFFSRTVPNDGVQGPSTARFIRDNLAPQKVVIIDDQTAYSVPLANSVQANMRANGIEVVRESVNQQLTDFSALVATIGDDVDVVYLPWQIAANGQLIAQQLREQGKRPAIVGSDGLFSGDFTFEGAYIFSFAPDIRGIPTSKDEVAAFDRRYGKNWGTFGPPAYLSAIVGMQAVDAACADGKVSRAEVAGKVRSQRVPNSILGGTFTFDKNGDVRGAKFFVFQNKGGKKVLVG